MKFNFFLSHTNTMLWVYLIFTTYFTTVKGTFYSALNPCPQSCEKSGVDSGNWTAYHDTANLIRCKKPMLLDFAIHSSLDDPDNHLTLFACSRTRMDKGTSCPGTSSNTTSTEMTETSVIVQEFWSGDKNGANTLAAVGAAQQALSTLPDTTSDCHVSSTSPTITFGYLNGSFVGLYLGANIHQRAAADLTQDFIDDLQKNGVKGNFKIRQICGLNRTSAYTVGIAASIPSTPGDISALVSVQNAVLAWSEAKCVATTSKTSWSTRSKLEVLEQTQAVLNNVSKSGECKTIHVDSGDSCGALAKRCGISPAQFTKYNPGKDLCSSLIPGQHVCCSRGKLPDFTPKPGKDGACAEYKIHKDESCPQIAAAHDITIKEIDSFNKNTWGWMGCKNIQPNQKICLSKGYPPMPAPLADAECGPQVPGTRNSTNGTELADLNPCPLNICCNIWGHCGMNADYCTKTKSPTGAPGTAKPGTNGCVSSCSTKIVVGDPPSKWIKLGYYEAFNEDRKCMHMDVRYLAGHTYNVIHFAFANITHDFKVDVSRVSKVFKHFKEIDSGFKKVLSFGGWSFSTSQYSFPIFRQGVTDEQRETFANNVVQFVKGNNLDGVDFDWEYPGAPDIPGIPPGDPKDGENYLDFLKLMRKKLPDDKTVSIAAPASYWYLKGFPIKSMSKVVDYIVYMTYDLHGQWDWDSPWASPGCDNGNCLRSHVNDTETNLALAMITKAGVPSSKVVVGVSSYGRSFQMTDPKCTKPHCTFTGPESGATPGECTKTGGYISNAELSDIIMGVHSNGTKKQAAPSHKSYYDESSGSDILTYGNNWVAYMNDTTMQQRTDYYKTKNFGGTTEWAVDLARHYTKWRPGLDDSPIFHEISPGGVDWERIPCDHPAIADLTSNMSYAERWAVLGADTAFAAMVAAYQNNPAGMTFSNFASAFLNGDPGFECGVISEASNCDDTEKCDETHDFFPANWAILNSMIEIHELHLNMYSALYNVQGGILTQISSIQGTFDPVIDDVKALQMMFDILLLGFAVMIAPVWNIALRRLPYFLTEEGGQILNTIKDQTNALVAQSVSLLKSGTVAGSALAAQNDVAATIGQLVNVTANAVESTNNLLFDGSDESITSLYNLMNHGEFINGGNGLTNSEIKHTIAKPFLGVIIPRMWDMSTHYPFVLDTGYDCSASDDDDDVAHMDPEDKKYARVCLDDKLYYMASVYGYYQVCSPSECSTKWYAALPGIGSLDGEMWEGLEVKDLVAGAVATYKSNGNKNGGDPADPGGEDGKKTIDEIFEDGIRAPGVVRIPVCDNNEVMGNWMRSREGESTSEHYPCD